MRAAVLKGWGRPLSIEDVEVPTLRPNEVLVRVRLTGVCHSDVHQWLGEWGEINRAMESNGIRIIGHEGIGEVVDVGPGVTRISVGTKVGIGWINGWCGACDPCLSGYPQWCVNAAVTSVTVDGTYAEYARVSERGAVPIPEGIPDVEAAPLLCAGVTAYGAVRKLVTELRIPPGKTVGIVGAAGGLGHFAVQIAKAFGYKVVGIDVGEERLELVRGLGADFVVDAGEAVEFSSRLGGLDAVIIFAPRVEGYNLGLRLLKTLGGLVGVGEPPYDEGPMRLVPMDLVERGIKIVPSAVGVAHEFRELFSLYLDGKVRSRVSRVASIYEVNEVLNDLARTRYVARAVLTI